MMLNSGPNQALDLFAAGTEVGNNHVNAQLVDGAHTLGGNTQTHKTLFAFHPETMVVQVREEPALGFVVGVGNIITGDGTLPGNLANFRH